MSTPRLAYSAQLLCSFCGKDHTQVRKLVAGPSTFICDECVTLAQEIIAEVDGAPAPAFTPAQEERAAQIAREIVATVLRGSHERIDAAVATAAACVTAQAQRTTLSPRETTGDQPC